VWNKSFANAVSIIGWIREAIMQSSMRAARCGVLASAVLGLGLVLGVPVFGDSGDSSGSKPDTKTCGKGEVWDSRSQKCVKAENGVLPDKNLADNAYALTEAGRYTEALNVLNLMKDPNTAVALNYRGYATRRMGRIDEGIGYYLKSVKLDPRYAQVREYLGEAYVLKGDVPRAEAQLKAIKTICGTTCEEYQNLVVFIADPVK
jgi:tetratricopeptide (TPR) repeat protein